MSATKYSGIKGLFNLHYVKVGRVSKEKGRLYNRLFDLWQEGDYLDFMLLNKEEIAPLIEATADFIESIRLLLKAEV